MTLECKRGRKKTYSHVHWNSGCTTEEGAHVSYLSKKCCHWRFYSWCAFIPEEKKKEEDEKEEGEEEMVVVEEEENTNHNADIDDNAPVSINARSFLYARINVSLSTYVILTLSCQLPDKTTSPVHSALAIFYLSLSVCLSLSLSLTHTHTLCLL